MTADNRIYRQDIFEISSSQKHPLGMLRQDEFGNEYAYAKAGASALSAGKMGLAAAAVANHQNCAVAAAAIGSRELTVTVGATAVTADQYKDGFAVVRDGTGEGQMFGIVSNTACDASGDTVVILNRPVLVALVASSTSEVSLFYNDKDGVIESATEEKTSVGIPRVAVTANYFYWAQVSGIATCLIEGTPAVGTMLAHGAVAGALAATETAVNIDEPIVGQMYGLAGVDGEYGLVKLMLR